MAAIIEHVSSRSATAGVENPARELAYRIVGTEDDAAAHALVQSVVPALYDGLVFQSYRLQHEGGGVWEATATYGKREPKDTGDSSYSFETGGGERQITQSITTIARYAPAGQTAPNFYGAIGVTNDRVEGCSIHQPTFSFAETHFLPVAVVTPSYKAILFQLTGRTNNAPFKGFAAGEVLFLGASGTLRSKDDWEIAYKFVASQNATGLSVGNITGIAKRGHEYLWVRYTEEKDATARVLVQKPQSVHIEQVYEEGDFSLLGIGV